MRSPRQNTITKLLYTLAIMVLGMTSNPITIHAQDLEPRAYANTPVGMNFILAGYQYSNGALLFDPTLPVTDANAIVNLGLLGYVRSLDIAGKSAKAGVLVPYAGMSADGYIDGDYRTRVTDVLLIRLFI
jgi:hypothetical protein